MKNLKTLAAITAAVILAGCGQGNSDSGNAAQDTHQKKSENVALDTHQKKLSYLAGMEFAAKYHAQGIALDANIIAMAVRDTMSGREELRLSEEEIAKTVETFQKDQLARQQELHKLQEAAAAASEEAFNKQAEANLKAGEAFLAENAQKEGVVTLDSGLQYKVITEGKGAVPAATDSVKVHYRGTLLDGTEFDSSHKRGVPATFKVTDVIPGWIEALQLMPEGSKWQLYVPSDLAYGPGNVGNIGPNSTLTFEIELLEANASEQSQE